MIARSAAAVLAGESAPPFQITCADDEGCHILEIRMVPFDRRRVVALIRDISQTQAAADALRDSEARKCAILGAALDAIMDLDDSGRVTELNPAAERMFGLGADVLSGRHITDLVFPESERAVRRTEMEEAFRRGDGHFLDNRIETIGARASGELFPVELAVTRIDLRGRIGFTAFLRDLTERRETEEALSRLAYHDTLTGLPNRALFVDRLDQACARAARRAQTLAVFFLDLDGFKVVNDSIGHAAGDRLLKVVAERLRACLREADSVARFGGDEFTLLIEQLPDLHEVDRVAARVTSALAEPVNLDGHHITPTASIGIAICTSGQSSAETLLRQADIAMYRSKSAGRGHHHVFNADMNDAAMRRLRIESALHGALEQGQFTLALQPIVDLETLRVREVEALLRWTHPELGFVSPAQFIPVAEDSGHIVPIGAWVIREGCRQLRLLMDRLGPIAPRTMAVNVSVRQLAQPQLMHQVRAALEDYDLEPSSLKLELTESTVMSDVEWASSRMRELKDLGVQIAVDDFGTGYSSLSYLKSLPLDTLKIDRSFVDGLGSDAQDTAIVRAIVALAHSLELQVTAEGVETPRQALELRGLGCERAQGYLMARPIPWEQLVDLLDKTGGILSVAEERAA
ncbi:MAG: EAL domain-containing protein [Chloroflexota bacterium]